MNRLSGKILDFCGRIIAPSALLSLFAILLNACFTGQSEQPTKRNNPAENAYLSDSIAFSQMTIASNASYSATLDNLNKDDLLNIDRAIMLFTGNKADSLSRDSMFVTFNEFMSGVMQDYYLSNLTENRKLMDQFESQQEQSNVTKLSESLAAHGIGITYREGDFYLEPNLTFIFDKLEKVLTNGSRNYLKTRISLATLNGGDKEQKLSPPDSLAYQIVIWEDFMLQNPEFILKDEIQAQYIDLLAAYLTGLEQLPLFDPETKMVNPVFKSSYLRFIKDYPNRESTGSVKKIYEMLASKGFKYDESMDLFLSDINFIPIQNPQ